MVRCMPPQNATFQHPAMPRSRRGPTHQTLIIHVVEKDDGGDSLAATASPPSRRFDFPHDAPRLLGHHFLSNLLFFSFFFFFHFFASNRRSRWLFLLSSPIILLVLCFLLFFLFFFFAIFGGDFSPRGSEFVVVRGGQLQSLCVFFLAFCRKFGLCCWVYGGGWCCEMISYCVFEHFGRERCSLWGIELGSFFASFVFFEHFLWVCW